MTPTTGGPPGRPWRPPRDCEGIKEFYGLRVDCCCYCHRWMQAGMDEPFFVWFDETNHPCCCTVMDAVWSHQGHP